MVELHGEWIAGFVDGEGCFFVGINRTRYGIGKQVYPELTVVVHERDLQILYALKNFFGVGVVRRNHGRRFCYRVRGLKALSTVIVPFFERYRLKTKKRVDFLKFRRILRLMNVRSHLTHDGLKAITNLAHSMNTTERANPSTR